MRLLPFVSIENRQLHLSHTNNRWRSGRGVAVALGRRVNTPQIAYRVAICPRGNLPYIQIYPISNTIIFSTFLANFGGFLLKQHGMPYYADYIADQP